MGSILLAFSILTLGTIVSELWCRRIVSAHEKLAEPDHETTAGYLNKLGTVTFVAILLGVVAIVLAKANAAVFTGYFLAIAFSTISASRARARILKLELSFWQHSLDTLRSYLFLFGIIAVYLLVIVALRALPWFSSWNPWAFTLFAVLTGFALMIASGPLLFALVYRAKDLNDPELLSRVKRRTDALGLPLFRLQVVGGKQQKVANAYVMGWVSLPGPFRARIFLTDTMLSEFNADEVDAIVAHEVSHFAQNHILKRALLPMLSYLALVGLALATVFSAAFASEELKPFLGLFAGLSVFLVYVFAFFFLQRKIVRQQELDADWMAVHRLGVDGALYYSTLDKLTIYSGASLKKKSPLTWLCPASAHPPAEERRRLVLDAPGKKPPFERRFLWRAVPALVAAVLVWGGALVWGLSGPERGIASDLDPPAVEPIKGR